MTGDPSGVALPHNVEAEQQLLGAILLSAPAIGVAIRRGGEDLFLDPAHRRIFGVCEAKHRAGELISPVTVAAAISSDEGLAELGGGRYLVRLAGSAVSTFAANEYVGLLADLARKRKIIAAMVDAQSAIARGEEKAGIIASRLEAALIAASDGQDGAGVVSMTKAATAAMEQAHAAYHGTDADFVRSGIPALDRIVGGFYPGELILIGGRPSMGKTAVALSIALNVARAGQGVGFASLEMNPEAMAMRAVAEETAQRGRGVTYSDMRRGAFSENDGRHMLDAAKSVAELPIMFLPRQFSDVGALVSGARQAHTALKGNMRALIVDYAQLVRGHGKSRYDQITDVSLALKALAGQLNIPVIALSQLSRAVETREDKRPMMSDLRESGQLEQDADTILFCYRDAYYVERTRPPEDALEDMATWQMAMDKAHNRLEIIVAKQRQGEIGTAHVRCNPAFNLIWEDPPCGPALGP